MKKHPPDSIDDLCNRIRNRLQTHYAGRGDYKFNIEQFVIKIQFFIDLAGRLNSAQEMADRIKAAVDSRTDEQFIIMARTDAQAVEGLEAAIERSQRYVEAGADIIFAEALTTLDEYRQFTAAIGVPVLANLTEFGKTPMFTTKELADVGIRMVLYPLSAFRAMSRAAEAVYQTLRQAGTQADVIDRMQTRDELYEVLGYHDYENKLDELFAEKGSTRQKD